MVTWILSTSQKENVAWCHRNEQLAWSCTLNWTTTNHCAIIRQVHRGWKWGIPFRLMLLLRPCTWYNMCLLSRRPTLFFFSYREAVGTNLFTVYCRVSQLPLKQTYFNVVASSLKVPCAMGNVLEPQQADCSHFLVPGRLNRFKSRHSESILVLGYQMDLSSKRALCFEWHSNFCATETLRTDSWSCF